MSTPAVELISIGKTFGAAKAVQDVSLAIPEGSFVTLLGPSGCGKTTTLRMIAGLLDPTSGEIKIKGKRVNETPIHKRNLGLVFQNYALFPHKTIFQNVAFGLKYRAIPGDQIQQKVQDALELVRLPDVGDRYPRQLSGGQQQRIALARAIVIAPDVLLLDEPLSALDAHLREEMRVELKRIQQQLGITTVFVTHDQSEALAMSDNVVVMSGGKIEQVGPPQEVYNEPVSEFVARFLGTSNILEGSVRAVSASTLDVEIPGLATLPLPSKEGDHHQIGDKVKVVLRAENILVRSKDAPADDTLSIPATIEAVDYQGQLVRYFVRGGDHVLQAINMIEDNLFDSKASVNLHIPPRDCAVLSR